MTIIERVRLARERCLRIERQLDEARAANAVLRADLQRNYVEWIEFVESIESNPKVVR